MSRLRAEIETTAEVGAVDGHFSIPWFTNKLDQQELCQEQKKLREYAQGLRNENDFLVHQTHLYSIEPPPQQIAFPRLYLPLKFQEQIALQAHEEVGHQGMERTLARLYQAYKWPLMRRTVQRVLESCLTCAVHQGRRKFPESSRMPIPDAPGQVVSCDLIGELPTSRAGFRYGLVVVDHYSNWPELKPLRNKTAEGVYRYFKDEYIPANGSPGWLICDNGGEFRAKIVTDLFKAEGTQQHFSSPFHPAANGRCERMNKSLKAMIAKLVNGFPHRWADVVGAALKAYRTSKCHATGFTPYLLHYGRPPPQGAHPLPGPVPIKQTDAILQRIEDNTRVLE